MKIGNRPGDDWQVPFSPASFSNTNFRLQITGTGGSFFSAFSLDQIQVKVNYTLPPVTINQAVVRRAALERLKKEDLYSTELIRNKEWELDLEEARLEEISGT